MPAAPETGATKPLAQVGYDAYGAAGNWKTFDGRPMPTWDELQETAAGRETARRWDVAATAISGAVHIVLDERGELARSTAPNQAVPASLIALHTERAEAFRAMGVGNPLHQLQLNLVTEVRRWVDLVGELSDILGAADKDDVCAAARRAMSGAVTAPIDTDGLRGAILGATHQIASAYLKLNTRSSAAEAATYNLPHDMIELVRVMLRVNGFEERLQRLLMESELTPTKHA